MTALQVVDNEVWTSSDTNLEEIARELRRARATVRSDDDEGVPQQVAEAAVLNLVVASSETAHLDEAAEQVEQLAQRHPSRLILFLRDREGDDRLAAQVNAVCTFQPGASRQVCCERLRLEGHGAYADQLHSIVPALVIPGVPLFVWWRGAPPLRSAMHRRLRQMSQRMLVDSSGFREAFAGLAEEVLKCSAESCSISDLAWGRLEGWREQIAQLFDPPSARQSLAEIERVEVTTTTLAFPTEAVLLNCWLASRLGWQVRSRLGQQGKSWRCSFLSDGRTIECVVGVPGGVAGDQAAGAISGLTITAGTVKMELSSVPGVDAVIEKVSIEGHTRTATSAGMKTPQLLNLLSQELELIGSDEVYERAVAVGAALSGT